MWFLNASATNSNEKNCSSLTKITIFWDVTPCSSVDTCTNILEKPAANILYPKYSWSILCKTSIKNGEETDDLTTFKAFWRWYETLLKSILLAYFHN
jgi:hypothetical protein